MDNHKIYSMPFSSIYPLYINKIVKKGRLESELIEVITWLTGYNEKELNKVLNQDVDFETFFKNAPNLNDNRTLITGVICGIRVETMEDSLMREIRYLDKLVDELARGKKMAQILRSTPGT